MSEINSNGFPLDRIKLEITESAVMRSPETTRAVLTQLHDLGIRVALDDFGTGYSALGALRHYRVDTIKIDREFTTRLETEDGKELVRGKVIRLLARDMLLEINGKYYKMHVDDSLADVLKKPLKGKDLEAFGLVAAPRPERNREPAR